jgi:uncharacterized protein YjbJ (UPF0337 family)
MAPARTASISPATSTERKTMNKDQVKGRVEQAKGSVKENTGKAVGDSRLQGEGKADKAAGKTQATYGDAKQKVKSAVNKA